MLMVVLAGGVGSRMKTHSPGIPKILIEVRGRPFLAHLVERFAASGFERVLLLTGAYAPQVEAAVAAVPHGLRELRCLVDPAPGVGTLGALRAAAHELDESFMLTYGDSYLTFDYGAPLRALRAHPSALGCMASWQNQGAIEPSNAAVRDGFVVRYDKSRQPGTPELDHIDYGASGLRRAALLGRCPKDHDLSALTSCLAREGNLLAYPIASRFYEIGSPSGLRALEAHLEEAAS